MPYPLRVQIDFGSSERSGLGVERELELGTRQQVHAAADWARRKICGYERYEKLVKRNQWVVPKILGYGAATSGSAGLPRRMTGICSR